jgi:DNA-directed RNA polymerase subunit K/omega
MSDDEYLGSDADVDDDADLNEVENEDDEEEESDSDYEKNAEEEKHVELDVGYDTDEDLELYNQEDCLYKHAKTKKKSYVVEDKSLRSSAKKWNKMTIVKKEDRITGDRMTDYEIIRILGVRTRQLMLGAPALIEVTHNASKKEIDYEELAKLELKKNKTPYIIMRPLPNNFVEKWYIEEMFVPTTLWG